MGGVSFVGIPAASAAATTVTTAATLEADFQNGGAYGLGGDITVATLAVGSGKAVTLILDGYDLTATGGPNSAGIGVPAGTSRTIEDSKTTGTVTATGGFDGIGIGIGIGGSLSSSGGTVTIAGGTVHATGGGPYG